jgi:hypothetical protein
LLTTIFPVVAGLSRIGRLTRPMRLFLILVSIGAAVEYGSFVMGKFHIHNLWLLQLYHLIDFVLILTLFRRWLIDEGKRTVVRWAGIVFVSLWVVAKFTIEPLTAADQYTYAASSLIILPIALVLLFEIAGDDTRDFVKESRFWVISGFLLYFAGNFILFSVFQWATSLALLDFLTVWTVHWSLNVVVNVIFTMSFLLVSR